MSDWEIVGNNEKQQSNSDWEIVSNSPIEKNSLPEENLGEAVLKSPFRVGEDIVRSAFKLAKEIPQYAESAKTEVPGMFSAIKNNPSHALGQGLAGITEMGHNVLNMPRQLAEYGENRLNLLPRGFSQNVPQQKDISKDINQLFGEPNYPGEKLIRGLGRNSLNLISGAKGASVLNPMNLTSKGIAKNVLAKRNENKMKYTNKYNALWSEAEKKGYSDLSHMVKDIDYKTIKKYSSPDKIAGVDDFIKNPTLKNAHNAKSDLLSIQRDLKKVVTKNTAERKHFNAVNNAINDIKNNMFKGASGIDKNMLNKYSKIQKGYSNEVVPYNNKAINKYMNKEITAKQLVNSLSKGPFMAKRGMHHPAIGIKNLTTPGINKLSTIALLGLLYKNMMGAPNTDNSKQ